MNEREEELHQRARTDYESVVGRILQASHLQGYVGEDSVEVFCDPPAKVMVEPHADEWDLKHWCDDWLDPYWSVTLVEPHPALVQNGEEVRSLWIYGPSYNVRTGEQKYGSWELDTSWKPAPEDFN